MARSQNTVRGRARLARDSQQWMLDYLIQETGKVFHFQGEGRGRLPRSVRSHDMISKQVGLQARRIEALAQAEAAAGHPETALDFYFQATVLYAGAQHVIFQNNDEKRYLYAGVAAAQAETGAQSLGLSPVQRPRPRRTAWRGGGSPQIMSSRKDLCGCCSPVFWYGYAVSISRDAPCGRCAAVWPVAYACFEFVTLSHASPCLRR